MILKLNDFANFYPQQRELFKAFFVDDYRYFIRLAHRRFGKDFEAFFLTVLAALQRPGVYLYLLPTINQSTKVIWQTVGMDGKRLIMRIPRILGAGYRNAHQMIELPNGSLIYVTGSDNYARLVGMDAKGVVISESQLTDFNAYNFLRPMVTKNKGWFLFNGTAMAYSPFKDLYDNMIDNPAWHVSSLPCDKTYDNDGQRIITEEMITQERANGMPEELIQQEYFCSWEATLVGAYFSKSLNEARNENRIGSYKLDNSLPVHTGWDLGIDDHTAIWFAQIRHGKIFLVDYYEAHNLGLEHYVEVLNEFKQKHQCYFSRHFAPHDIEVRELGPGKTRRSQAREKGLNFIVVPAPSHKIEGIHMVRHMFPRFYIDSENCKLGLKHLSEYRSKYDPKLDVYSAKPIHDRSSHGFDALQSFCMGWLRDMEPLVFQAQKKYANLYGMAA